MTVHLGFRSLDVLVLADVVVYGSTFLS